MLNTTKNVTQKTKKYKKTQRNTKTQKISISYFIFVCSLFYLTILFGFFFGDLKYIKNYRGMYINYILVEQFIYNVRRKGISLSLCTGVNTCWSKFFTFFPTRPKWQGKKN